VGHLVVNYSNNRQ